MNANHRGTEGRIDFFQDAYRGGSFRGIIPITYPKRGKQCVDHDQRYPSLIVLDHCLVDDLSICNDSGKHIFIR